MGLALEGQETGKPELLLLVIIAKQLREHTQLTNTPFRPKKQV